MSIGESMHQHEGALSPACREMESIGRQWAEEQVAQDPSCAPLGFALGFHALPSMPQLHMHVVSRDMDSDRVKTKRHFNTFTTAFFIPVEAAIARLEERGEVRWSEDEVAKFHGLERKDMECHLCGERIRNMPSLKAHLRGHLDG